MKERFITEYVDEKIIFTDLKTKREIIVKHYDNPQCFDLLKIDKNFGKDFVKYIIKELRKTKI